MNAAEADELVRRLANHWSREPDEAERAGWRACLAPVPAAIAEAVLAQVQAEKHQPSQRRFLELAQDMARRQPSGRPRRTCPHCDGNGWRYVQTEGGVEAVVRCVCVPPPPEKHERGCTCSVCMIGPPEPDQRPRAGPDPLALAEPEVPGGLF